MTSKNPKIKVTAWLVCAIAAVFYAYEYLLRICPSAMESQLRHHYALTATGFGLLSSIYYYAYVPMQLPVGILMDRFGPRRLLTFACIVCAIGAFIFAGTDFFELALLGRLLIGFGSAFAFVGVLKLATIWFPENKLAMIAGLTSAIGTVGAMIGDNVLDKIVELSSWQQTIIWIGIIGFVLTGIIWFCIHDHKRDLESGGTIDNFKQNIYDLFIILKSPQIWLNGMIGCLIYLPTTVFAELWGIPYLQNAHNLSASDAGFANSLVFLGFMVGAPMMGFISDKISRRKLPMTIGAIGATIVMCIIIYMPISSLTILNTCMFVLGLFYSCQTIVFAIGRELSPNEAAGTAFAVTNMLVMLGAMFLQPLIGKLLDMSFIYRTPQAIVDSLSKQNINLLYSAADYKFAISIIPIGIAIAAILTFFMKETFAEAKN